MARFLKLAVRVVVTLVAALFALQLFSPALALLLPALSPFSGLMALVARRSFSLITILCLPVLLLCIFRRRWFCVNVCPTGLLTEYTGKLHPSARTKYRAWPFLGRWLMVLTLGGAIIGTPLFLWLDPLVIFNGFFAAWRTPLVLASFLQGAGLVVILLLTLWRPNAWCYRLCPLGAFQEWLCDLRRKVGRVPGKCPENEESDPSLLNRRGFVGVLTGGVLAAAVSHCPGMKARRSAIRPPGAAEETRFLGLCARCGNCVRACPERVIYPDLGETGWAGWMTPVIRMEPSYCSEFCNECNKVCPTGAIGRMSLDEKRDINIGTVEIIKKNCLAWEKLEHCVICEEYCPFQALRIVDHKGIPCPVVDEEICRGCGLCQTVCPAEPKAIVVRGGPQKKLAHVEI